VGVALVSDDECAATVLVCSASWATCDSDDMSTTSPAASASARWAAATPSPTLVDDLFNQIFALHRGKLLIFRI